MTDQGPPAVPPWLASQLLRLCLADFPSHTMCDDLTEEFTERVETHGRAPARRWYWGQAVRSMWPALTLEMRGAAVRRAASGLLLGMVILWSVGGIAVPLLATTASAKWISATIPFALLNVLDLLFAAPVAALGGFATAWRGGRGGPLATMVLACLVAVPCVAATHAGVFGWPQMVWLLLGPSAVIIGGREFGQRHRAPA